jgi:Stage II sporulation protein E (SpoIIE)
MRRILPWAVCALGTAILLVLLPHFNSSQPHGLRLTRGEAQTIADRNARSVGIPVDRAWSALSWEDSSLLSKELDPDPDRRRRAEHDPVIGPRLGGYYVNYYRRDADKNTPFGSVYVSGQTGEVIAARRKYRNEQTGAQLTEAVLRPRADAFVHSRKFSGAPSPQFESARPNVLRSRTDWIFRYRVPSTFSTGNVVPYLFVHFAGDQLAGWELIEEYADGSRFVGDNLGAIFGILGRFGLMLVMLLALLMMFLRKYHSGEVGVGTASLLFGIVIVSLLALEVMIYAAAGEGTGLGSLNAQYTALAVVGFKFLLADLPLSVIAFLAWAVGESYARERWGERLASFDAILRRSPFNATVGRSLLNGVLMAPALAAAAFLAGIVPLATHLAHPSIGPGTQMIVSFGGPLTVIASAVTDAALYSVVAILFVLAFSSRRRVLPAGIAAAVLLGMAGGLCQIPIDPFLQRCLFGFGGIAAAVAVFLATDLLATAVTIFFGSMLVAASPLLSVARGHEFESVMLAISVPLALTVVYATAGMLTRREVVYTYEDMAPHVKRIVERERVKAEIDAANRIQAALLPVESPTLPGAEFASHYRAASEIGGDYFDFLPRPGGEIGIAFGDVSGHGLTSGIVMAMAKAALLVQVDYNASPRAVLEVLNEIVMKTAPRRILMTFFFGLLDPVSQELRFSSAGHLDPYVYRARDRRLEALSSWGFPLGVRRRDPFRELTVRFDAGDRLILYSDGLIEAVDDDGEPFGFDRFERVLLSACQGSAEEIKRALLASLRKFTRNRPPEDDQTLVVVSFDEPSEARLPEPLAAAVEYSPVAN